MSSAVDICNLALSYIGDEANVISIDPPEGSSQAGQCARFYPLALQAVMAAYPWNFALKRARLAQLVDAPEFGWQFAYAVPSDADSIVSVHWDGATDEQIVPFLREINQNNDDVILTDQDVAFVRYTVKVTDAGKLPPLVVACVAYLLASYLAGPIIKGDSGHKAALNMQKEFSKWFSAAKVADAQQSRIQATHKPEWLQHMSILANDCQWQQT